MGSGCLTSPTNQCYTPVSAGKILVQPINNIKQENSSLANDTISSDHKQCETIFKNNKKKSLLRKSVQKKANNYSMDCLVVDSRIKLSNNVEQTKTNFDENDPNFKKRKLIELNKHFVSQSIEASKCVQQALNILGQRHILKDSQYNLIQKLKAKNLKGIISKQNRFKNLTAKDKKLERNSENIKANRSQSVSGCNNVQVHKFRGRKILHKRSLFSSLNNNQFKSFQLKLK